MKVVVNNLRNAVPSAYITKSKQRVKQYNDTIFLNNGDEFEIELFNPTQEKILAKIELNGSSIGSGIVLRPGERVFLERYFDSPQKFLFETYDVNGNNKDVMKAVENNGLVKVKFYEKEISWGRCDEIWWNQPSITINPVIINPPVISPIIVNPPTVSPYYYGTNTSIPSMSEDSFTTNTFYSSSDVTNKNPESFSYTSASATLGFTRSMKKSDIKNKKQGVETGRIEMGSISEQHFGGDYTSFNSWYTWETTWKILPHSRKMITKDDLNVFCTNCGSKRKKDSHKFCPNCGNKY